MGKRYSWLLTIGLSTYVALFIIRDIIQINIPGAIFMAWFVGILLLLPRSEMMKAIFFIMPFAGGVPGYTILLSLFVLILKSKKLCIWQIIPPAIIALLEFTNVAFYDFDIRFQSVISYIGFVALFFFTLFDKDSSTDIKACLRFFCYGTVITLLIVYIPIILNHGILSLIAGEVRSGFAMGYEDNDAIKGHLAMNANTIAYFSISLLSLLLLGRKTLIIKSKLLYLFAVLVVATAGILSFSRTWLLLTAIIIILYVINSKHRTVAIILVIITSSIIITTQNIVVESISSAFKTRMEDETLKTGGGRFDIFIEYNRVWSEKINHIAIGTGATHYGQVIEHNHSMHNGLQQIWVCHGIIGFLIFAAAFVHYFRRYRNKHIQFTYYLPFIACFIFDQSIQFLVPYTLMFPFIPTLYVLRLNAEPARTTLPNPS